MEMTFEEFEPEFMTHFDGYVPIWVGVEDSDFVRDVKDSIKRDYRMSPNFYKTTLRRVHDQQIKEGKVGFLKVAQIEMICPSRMSDGPTRFYRSYEISVNDEQVKLLSEWMVRAGEWWKTHFDKQSTDILKNEEDDIED
jgi:hypothetical protein